MAEKLIRNTFSSAVGYGVTLAVGLLLAPYMLAKLGAEQFGLWIILAVVTSYFGLLDLGVGASFIKHLTEAHTLDQRRRLNEIMATGWLFYLLFSLLIVAAGAAARDPILGLLSIEGDVAFIYAGTLAIFAVRSTFQIYRSMLYALQRLDALNLIEIATGLFNAAATIAALAAGYGLRGVVTAALGTAIVHVSAEAIMAHRLCPGLTISPRRANLAVFRSLFRYGVQLQASRCAELIHLHVDKLLLSHVVGLTQVTMYELGAKVAGLTRSFPTVLLPAILPAASALEAQRNRADLLRLYERGSKYLVGLALPLAVFTVVSAQAIIDLWLGPGEFGGAVLAVRALAAAYLFHLLTGMGLAIARGIGVVQYEMRALTVSAALNAGASALLVTRFGLTGVLAATVVSTIVGYALFMRALHGFLERSFIAFARRVYALPAAGSAAAAAAILSLGYPAGLLGAQPSRGAALLALAVSGALFFSIYGAILLRARYIAWSEWSLVRKALATSSRP
ncbi:MAG: oligosaccharide flippase family protein [Nitrospirota bacterium]